MAIDFERLPFEEAIAASRERRAVTREQFDAMEAAAQARAFTVAWQQSAAVIADIYAAHLAALAGGGTLRDFRRQLPQMLAERGWGGDRPWHADLVYRQQGQMAYQAGRFQQMAEAGVTHWRYRALLDGRVRPAHAALDGRVFKTSDRRFYPPWEFNCRCWAEPVFDEELEGETVDSAAALAGQRFGADPESGEPLKFPGPPRAGRFGWDPQLFARAAAVDLSGLPTGLQAGFEAVLKREGIAAAKPGPAAAADRLRRASTKLRRRGRGGDRGTERQSDRETE